MHVGEVVELRCGWIQGSASLPPALHPSWGPSWGFSTQQGSRPLGTFGKFLLLALPPSLLLLLLFPFLSVMSETGPDGADVSTQALCPAKDVLGPDFAVSTPQCWYYRLRHHAQLQFLHF